jgi:hypothetical protein
VQDKFSGFGQKNFVDITFNVIVPQHYWLWDRDTKMYLRFGHPQLGNWKDVGKFESCK